MKHKYITSSSRCKSYRLRVCNPKINTLLGTPWEDVRRDGVFNWQDVTCPDCLDLIGDIKKLRPSLEKGILIKDKIYENTL